MYIFGKRGHILKKLVICLAINLCCFIPQLVHAEKTFWECYDDILMTEAIKNEHNPHGSVLKTTKRVKNASLYVNTNKRTVKYYITSKSLDEMLASDEKPTVFYENIIAQDGIITGTDIHWEDIPDEFSTFSLDTRNGLLFRTVVLDFKFTKFYKCKLLRKF